MKSNKEKQYDIELNQGIVRLTRGRMGAVLLERKLHLWIIKNNFENLGMELLYGWKGYLNYSDDELIQEVQKYFSEPKEIKELLRVQNKRLKILNAKLKEEFNG